jgi:hypothetical protein
VNWRHPEAVQLHAICTGLLVLAGSSDQIVFPTIWLLATGAMFVLAEEETAS